MSDATGYKVEWKSGGQKLQHQLDRQASSPTSGSTTITYLISGLNSGTQYTVRVYRHQDRRERRTASVGDATRHTIRHLTDGHLRTRLLHRLRERSHRESNGRD